MRLWFSGPRVLGVRPGVSLNAREAAGLAREIWGVAKWIGIALVLLYAYGQSARADDLPRLPRECIGGLTAPHQIGGSLT
jgi:hypothetical protein